MKLLQDLGVSVGLGGTTVNHVLQPGLGHGHIHTIYMEGPEQ